MKTKTNFAPVLTISSGITDVSFYTEALGAVEVRRFSNDDGTVHVSEFELDGILFHLHEERPLAGSVTPQQAGGTTVLVGLFVDDVHAVMKRALAAGATETSPVQDYDYGYRQGQFIDPFGHHWQIQKAI